MTSFNHLNHSIATLKFAHDIDSELNCVKSSLQNALSVGNYIFHDMSCAQMSWPKLSPKYFEGLFSQEDDFRIK